MHDGDKPKKKTMPPSAFKAMTKDSTKAPSPTNPIMVEKADGSIGQWGNPLPPEKKTIRPVKKTPELSNKARGLDNTYYPSRGQQQGPDVQTVKSNYKY